MIKSGNEVTNAILKPNEILIGLQLLRAIAALLVVFYHTGKLIDLKGGNNSSFFSYFDFGQIGVQLFFMVSGYIILFVHFRDFGKPETLFRYSFKRAARIYPLYLLVTLPLVLGCFNDVSCGAPYHHTFETLIKSIFLFPENHSPYLGVAWTLTHEVFFYLSISIFILSRRVGTMYFTLWLLGIIVFQLFISDTNYPDSSQYFPASFIFSSNNIFFFIGMFCYLSSNIFVRFINLKMFIFGLVLIPLYALASRIEYFKDLSIIILVFAGFLMLLSSNQVNPNKILEPLLLIGNASYSIYLIHNPIFGQIIPMGAAYGAMNYPSLFGFLIIVVVLVAGVAIHLFVEKPIFAVSRILLRRIL